MNNIYNFRFVGDAYIFKNSTHKINKEKNIMIYANELSNEPAIGMYHVSCWFVRKGEQV